MKVKPPFIIAEAAQGFEGSQLLAALLVKAAASAKADAIKFQLVYADEIATSNYNYYKLFKKLELKNKVWKVIASDARKAKLQIYFDIFGERSLSTAINVGASGLKIHATDFYNDGLLKLSLRSNKKLLVSCSGITKLELEDLFKRHPSILNPKVTFLHGFQAEPTPIAANNLQRLDTLRKMCHPAGVGFMDHSHGGKTEGLDLSLLALSVKIKVIEKHITLDRNLKLEDYVSGLSPEKFRTFVQKIRKYTTALGSPIMSPRKIEAKYRSRSAKIVIAAKNLYKNQQINLDDIKLLRTKNQETYKAIYNPKTLYNKKLARSILKNRPIEENDVKK